MCIRDRTRIVNTRKRWSEFLGFKIRVRLKHHKYVVQSAICDKKVELERAKLVEQAKNLSLIHILSVIIGALIGSIMIPVYVIRAIYVFIRYAIGK